MYKGTKTEENLKAALAAECQARVQYNFYAKKARGMMARYVIEHKIDSVAALRNFNTQGYYYSAEQSKPEHLVFLRDQPED